jgi:hypothetical protein
MLRNLIKRIFNLYDIEDLRAGAHCGCCGKWIPDEVIPEVFPWSICDECARPQESESPKGPACSSFCK